MRLPYLFIEHRVVIFTATGNLIAVIHLMNGSTQQAVSRNYDALSSNVVLFALAFLPVFLLLLLLLP